MLPLKSPISNSTCPVYGKSIKINSLVCVAANAIAPGKRPLSSMSPTIVTRAGKPLLVLGTPGGSRIITMVLLGVLGYADGLDAQQVAALPRYHHQWLPDVVDTERDALPDDVIAALRAMGHVVVTPKDAAGGQRSSDTWGNLQTVEWNLRDNTLHGGSDPRNPVGEAKVEAVPATAP